MDRKTSPDEPQEGEVTLVNMSALAATLGVTRQWLHVLRTKDPAFPEPRRVKGSTRDVFDVSEVEAYYKQRLREPGRRTDRELARAVVSALAAGHPPETVSEQLSVTVERVREIELVERNKKRKPKA